MITHNIDRRSFLKVAAGLVAFVPAARALAQDNPLRPVIVENVQQFISPEQIAESEKLIASKCGEGDLISVSKESLAIRESNGNTLNLVLNSSSRIWKGGWEDGDPLEAGDKIFAWGERTEQSLVVEQVYANIVNLQGKYLGTDKSTPSEVVVTHSDFNAGIASVQLNTKTEIIDSETDKLLPIDSLKLKENQFMQVVGLRLRDGSVRATRAFV